MRTILLGLLSVIAIQLSAQRQCGTSHYVDQQKAVDASFESNTIAVEQFLKEQKSQIPLSVNGTTTAKVFRIPVVVHVLYNTSTQNISNEQIKSQLEVLNRDFRRQNTDAANTPVRFLNLAADMEIEFVLATADPKGRATSGIVRKHTSVTEWKMDDKIKFTAQGGSDAWDTKSYLNIWIGNMRNLLGYSSTVVGAPEKDGIVINPIAFGTMNVNAPYHLGRTTVHEVGHWLGLKHIWGDTYCGDDLVNDTPLQQNYTTGCPDGFRAACNNDPLGSMYMNFMDFTNDACMNLFTVGQKERIHSLFNNGGPRNSLLSSKGLNEPWLEQVDLPQETVHETFKLYPNPAVNDITLNFSDVSWLGGEIRVVGINGITHLQTKATAITQKLSLASIPKGVYLIIVNKEDQQIKQKFVKL